jgi:hypothetical protein
VPLLDPIKDMHVSDEAFRSLLTKAQALEDKFKASAMHGRRDRDGVCACVCVCVCVCVCCAGARVCLAGGWTESPLCVEHHAWRLWFELALCRVL